MLFICFLLDFISLKMTAPRFYAHLCKKIAEMPIPNLFLVIFYENSESGFAVLFKYFMKNTYFTKNAYFIKINEYFMKIVHILYKYMHISRSWLMALQVWPWRSMICDASDFKG